MTVYQLLSFELFIELDVYYTHTHVHVDVRTSRFTWRSYCVY